MFAGLRYLDVNLTVQLIPVNPAIGTLKVDSSDTFSDFMIGGRYTWALSEHWGLTLRGDTSFGETDGTWNASVVANYRTRHGAWLFGYRYLDGDIAVRNSTAHITLSGPAIGYTFAF